MPETPETSETGPAPAEPNSSETGPNNPAEKEIKPPSRTRPLPNRIYTAEQDIILPVPVGNIRHGKPRLHCGDGVFALRIGAHRPQALWQMQADSGADRMRPPHGGIYPSAAEARLALRFGAVTDLEFAQPDVAEADRLARVAVALQLDGAVAVLHHAGQTDILGGTEDGKVVQQHDAVLDYGNGGMYLIRAVLVEDGGIVDDVVHVPLARLAHGVGQRHHVPSSLKTGAL